MSASCAYEGWVRHRRYNPIAHELRKPLFMLLLDLDELPSLFDGLWAWSARGPALAWYRRSDHLGDPTRPLNVEIRDLVQERVGERPQGPIRLLTHLRYFGHCINPVSFYYCYEDVAGENLSAVVAEVTNTPWGERYAYVLGGGDGRRVLTGRLSKELHVSPFMGMDQTYDWRMTAPGEELVAHINTEQDEQLVFDATLSLRRQELTPATLRRLLVRHPAMTLQVAGGIYGQALRLWRKGAPYHSRPLATHA